MILVSYFVSPTAEPTAGIDAFFLQCGEQFGEHTFAFEGGCRISMVEAAMVGRHDFVGGLEHLRINEALDAVCQ